MAQNANCADIRGNYSASDGDLDAAFALLLADAQWGSKGTFDYARQARRVLRGIVTKDVNSRTRLIGLGDWTRMAAPALQTGSRPSDWMLDHFTAFSRLKGAASGSACALRSWRGSPRCSRATRRSPASSPTS